MNWLLIKAFTKLPKPVARLCAYSFIMPYLAVRFFLGTVSGAFLLIFIIYISLFFFTSTTPFTPKELFHWHLSLSAESRATSISTAVTLTGILVAFHVATTSTQNQVKLRLQQEAIKDITEFFDEFIYHMTNARLFADFLYETYEISRKWTPESELQFRIHYIQQEVTSFEETRAYISKASRRVNTLASEHWLILSSQKDVKDRYDEASECIIEIANKIWFDVPVIPFNSSNPIHDFVMQLNATQYGGFVDACKRKEGTIAFAVGVIRGRFTGFFFRPNFPMLLGIIKNFDDFFDTLKSQLNKSGDCNLDNH